MKAVMLSIQPKWCELIASGKKTIEVRKTKIPVGSKVYIYQTKKNWIFKLLPWLADRRGKVICEFVCDEIKQYKYIEGEELEEYLYPILTVDGEKTGLDYDDIEEYGKGNPIYFWHISDLKIYDKPKELREFQKAYKRDPEDIIVCKHEICPYVKENGHWAYRCWDCADLKEQYKITRPPQSWCYVEELE